MRNDVKPKPPAATATTDAGGRPEFRLVRIALIDDPAITMRQTLDETKLGELIADIKANGLLQPIGVVKAGSRYRIAWGHRRAIACRAMEMLEIPAMIFPPGTPAEEAMKFSENAVREDVKPADEADYFAQLLEQRCGGDVDKLAQLVRRGRDFVEGRLLLLRGDPDVLEALRAGAIAMGVAEWLNRCVDRGSRMVYLQSAVESGATVKLVRDWVQRSNAYQEWLEGNPPDNRQITAPTGHPADVKVRCAFCGGAPADGPGDFIFVHRICDRQFRQRLMERAAQIGEEAADEG